MVRLIRATDYRRVRWKNGLGETAEIAIAPADAAVDAFDWRISMARVEAHGPFSAFPGVDRTLTVLDGEGLRLTVECAPTMVLTPGSAPFAFAGDIAAAATLVGGPVTDLNVMTRRDRFRHRVRRVVAGTEVVDAAECVAVFCVAGEARVGVDGRTVALGARDTLLLDPGPRALELGAEATTSLLLVAISRR